jgi:cytosine permease
MPIERRSWQNTIAPHYIGLFLWIVFFDQLGTRALPVAGLLWSVLGAAVGGVLCTILLYEIPAMWGWQTGRPLPVVASSTFGVDGSAWLTCVVMGAGLVVWQAVATYFAVELTFEGLVQLRLLDPRQLNAVSIGRLTLKGPLFLLTSLTWSFAAAAVGAYLVRVIAALMKVYPVFPAIMFGTSVLLTIKGAPDFRPSGIDPATGQHLANAGPRTVALLVQLIFGFFATAAASSVDWGATCREKRDVRMGGWVGIAFASWVIATLSFLTIAGALGAMSAAPATAVRSALSTGLSFHAAVESRLGGRFAAALLLLFGLGSLAPNCYASFTFGHRFAAKWPRVSRIRWTMIGTAVAWPLVATGAVARLDAIFEIMGAVFAPMIAAIVADYARAKGTWPGPRRGVSQAGIVAWAIGLTVGLVPTIGRAWSIPMTARFQPASLFAFLTAYVVYRLLAAAGAESPSAVPVIPASGEATPENSEPVESRE